MPADSSIMRPGRSSRKFLPWATAILACMGIAALYRWASPPLSISIGATGGGESQVITLHNSQFRHVVNGRLQWKLTADLVAAKRPASGVTHMIANAVLTNIHNATVYAPTTSSKVNDATETPVMTFTAGSGSYSVGASGPLATQIQTYGLAQWNFTLSNGVNLNTAQCENIQAPQLTLIQYISRQTGKQRQEVMCRQGASISQGGTSVHATTLDYHPEQQSAEATDGVTIRVNSGRGKLSVFYSTAAFWSLKYNTVRCPYTVTGTVDGDAITATNVSLDAKAHTITASTATLDMGNNSLSTPHTKDKNTLPSASAHTPGNSAPIAGYAVVTFNPLSGNQSNGVYRGYNFTYVHKDETAKGDYAVWNSHEQLLTAKGHLVYDSNDYVATCSSAQVNRKSHQRVFEGAVVLTIKPRKSATSTPTPASTTASADTQGANNEQEARSHSIIVHCDKVVYSSITHIAQLTGHLIFQQNYVDKKGKKIARNATADHAVYDDNEQTLTLFPPVRYHDSQGEVLTTDDPLIISTRTNDETFAGKATTLLIPDSVLNQDTTPSGSEQPSAGTRSSEAHGKRKSAPPAGH